MIKEFPIIDEISIDSLSATPKYIQVAKAILKAVYEERIKKNETLPSINELSFSLDISRDTVEKSYRHLKERGIVGSIPGKGFFVKSIEVDKTFKVLLLFNKLSEHKKVMYDAFLESLDGTAEVDIYVYNNDYASFKKLILNRLDDYTHFVVMALFAGQPKNAEEVINIIPKEKLILFDKRVPGVTGEYAAVFENFDADIYYALDSVTERISRYHTVKIVFPEKSYHAPEIISGIRRFTTEQGLRLTVVTSVEEADIAKGDLVLTVSDKDLMALVEEVILRRMKPGRDLGIISYNESPCKKFILGGITTVSTNFRFMGRQAARLIMEGSTEHVQSPFEINLRASL